MNIFKGKEEIDTMNKSEVIEFMKELMLIIHIRLILPMWTKDF